jgi:hypothetical protein
MERRRRESGPGELLTLDVQHGSKIHHDEKWRNQTMPKLWMIFARGFAALVLLTASASAFAWPCDFLTGGGFIVRDSGAKANFGVGGGCKHGTPTWGHLQYIDHGVGLNVHWTSITAYFEVDSSTDAQGRLIGARLICGTARTNLFGDVDWVLLARDRGEPGVDDEFIIRLKKTGLTVYTTEGDSNHTLGGAEPGGGNIQLHKPNPSTTGDFGGSCPAL